MEVNLSIMCVTTENILRVFIERFYFCLVITDLDLCARIRR